MKPITAGCILALLTIVTSAHSDAPLLGLWSMNEEPGATVLHDSSGNGRHAAMDADVSVQSGLFGQAAAFSGDNVAGTGATISLPAFSNITVAAWIYYTGATNKAPRILNSSVFVLVINPTMLANHPIQLNVNAATTGVWLPTASELPTNRWIHIAVTYGYGPANSAAVFYMNGLRQKTTTSAFPSAPNFKAGAATIGNSSDKARPFAGRMDDFRIYDAVLTDREIYALATARPPQAYPGPAQTVTRAETLLSGQIINTNPFIPDLTAGHLWQQVSGPAALIDRPDRLETGVTLPETGTYQFALTVSNGLDSAVYTNQVTRAATASGNAAPVVSTTGSATSCARPFNALLKGTVADDGIPVAVASVRKRWRKVSGPGGVFFDTPYALMTQVGFSAPGTYTVALDADDGDKTGSATVAVTVTDAEAEVSAPDTVWLPFDELMTTNIVYDTLHGRRLNLLAGAFLQPGKTGNALRCQTATAYAQTAAASPDGLASDFAQISMAAWINCAGWTNFNVAPRIFQGQGGLYWIWEKGAAAGKHKIGMGSTDMPDMAWYSPGGYVLPTNAWHHLAVTVDRSQGTNMVPKFYFNGRLMEGTPSANSYTGAFKSVQGMFTVGGNGSTRNLDALVDDFRFYGRILTPEEIQLLAVDPDNNHAPVIEAPHERLIVKTGQRFALPVAAWDDGLPSAEAAVTGWSVTGGDAEQVHFENVAQPASAVTFARSGNYVLKLTMSDGVFAADESVDVLAVASGTVFFLR